jgi:hypothetical protein
MGRRYVVISVQVYPKTVHDIGVEESHLHTQSSCIDLFYAKDIQLPS